MKWGFRVSSQFQTSSCSVDTVKKTPKSVGINLGSRIAIPPGLLRALKTQVGLVSSTPICKVHPESESLRTDQAFFATCVQMCLKYVRRHGFSGVKNFFEHSATNAEEARRRTILVM